MKKLTLLLLSLFCLVFSAFSQKQIDVDGVIVPRTISFDDKNLELNGIGIRSKLWFDVYTQALYLTKLSQDPNEIMNSDSNMAVRIQITSSMVSSRKFSKAINNGLEKSVGEANISKYRTGLDLLEKYINSDVIIEGDVFNLIYNSNDKSMWILKNDKLKGKIIGLDFKKAFFGIWLSENPIDQKLKNDLLGKS